MADYDDFLDDLEEQWMYVEEGYSIAVSLLPSALQNSSVHQPQRPKEFPV